VLEMEDHLFSYELYTPEGEALCRKLMEPILEALRSELSLARREAIRLAGFVIREVEKIDGGMGDSEPRWAMSHVLNKEFRALGLAEISGYDLAQATADTPLPALFGQSDEAGQDPRLAGVIEAVRSAMVPGMTETQVRTIAVAALGAAQQTLDLTGDEHPRRRPSP
jgi:hypothetical protein